MSGSCAIDGPPDISAKHKKTCNFPTRNDHDSGSRSIADSTSQFFADTLHNPVRYIQIKCCFPMRSGFSSLAKFPENISQMFADDGFVWLLRHRSLKMPDGL